MKKHKRYPGQLRSDRDKEYDEMESSGADMTDFRRPAYAVQHPARYSDSEYSVTHNTSKAGELIRTQSEQIRETPAEYVARKHGIRGDADGHNKGTAPELPK